MKNITICVTGSIAIYKVIDLISNLKQNYNINIIMTNSAKKFINPILFETLTKNKVIIDMFENNKNYDINHISIAKKSDLLLICPATANIISKLAYGIADDMVSTTALSVKCPILIAPAMNSNMYNNIIIQNNILKLKTNGYFFVDPIDGKLACGDIGIGKLADIKTILFNINFLTTKHDLQGIKILVTAGATKENFDSIRFLSNHSSGKMGYAIAHQAALRGASVTLITGHTSLDDIPMIKIIKVYSANDMYDSVMKNYLLNNFIIKAAAVSDYKFENIFDGKYKKYKKEIDIKLTLNSDILFEIGRKKLKNQILCGFCMEMNDNLKFAYEKLNNKNCDFIVANNVKDNTIGFNSDINTVNIINNNNNNKIFLNKKTKIEISNIILNQMNILYRKIINDRGKKI